jgi:hypothetical protein
MGVRCNAVVEQGADRCEFLAVSLSGGVGMRRLCVREEVSHRPQLRCVC